MTGEDPDPFLPAPSDVCLAALLIRWPGLMVTTLRYAAARVRLLARVSEHRVEIHHLKMRHALVLIGHRMRTGGGHGVGIVPCGGWGCHSGV